MIHSIGGKIGKVVWVSNQEKAKEFYTKKLGLDLRVHMDFGNVDWIEVAPKESHSIISLMTPKEERMPMEDIEWTKKAIGIPTDIWLYTNNIEKTYQELKSNGVDISKPEKQEFGTLICKIKDPDGNLYILMSSSLPSA